MEEAKKIVPNIHAQAGYLTPRKVANFSTDKILFPELSKKLKIVYDNEKGLSASQMKDAQEMMDNFLKGRDINLRFSFGPNGKSQNMIIRALMTIYANTSDIPLQIKAKNTVKDSLNPLLNPQLAIKIIETYNSSKFKKYPIKKIDSTVNWALEKGFELNFEQLWDSWIKKNVGPKNSYITGNFVGLLYNVLTGMGGTRNSTWFAQYYNDYKKNPERFTQQKAVDPSKVKLDRSNHTISDIIQYIYNVGASKFDPKRADAFNKANDEILQFLKKNVKNPLSHKVFEYIVMKKLDPEEIIDFDRSFSDAAKVTGSFRDLAFANKKASQAVDAIYKKYKLNLPPFSTWKTSDFIKGPSDRGELKPDAPEVGVDKKGKLSKINYDKFGEPTYTPLQEVRMLVRQTLIEHIKTIINTNQIT